jgi:hypothetical protein
VIPSVGDLRRKSEITDAEIEAATEAYLKDEGAPLGEARNYHAASAIRGPRPSLTSDPRSDAPSINRTLLPLWLVEVSATIQSERSRILSRCPQSVRGAICFTQRRVENPAVALGIADSRPRMQQGDDIPAVIS